MQDIVPRAAILGGHIGLFTRGQKLNGQWLEIARWIASWEVGKLVINVVAHRRRTGGSRRGFGEGAMTLSRNLKILRTLFWNIVT